MKKALTFWLFVIYIYDGFSQSTDTRSPIKYARIHIEASRKYTKTVTKKCDEALYNQSESYILNSSFNSGFIPYEQNGLVYNLTSQMDANQAPKMQAFSGSGSAQVNFTSSEKYPDYQLINRGSSKAPVHHQASVFNLQWDAEGKALTGGLQLNFGQISSMATQTKIEKGNFSQENVPELGNGVLASYSMLCGSFVFQNTLSDAMKPYLDQVGSSDVTGNLTGISKVMEFAGGFTVTLTYVGEKLEPLKEGCTGSPAILTCQTQVKIFVFLEPPPPLIARIVPVNPQQFVDYLPVGKPVYAGDPDLRRPISFKILLFEKNNPTVEVTAKYPFTVYWEILEKSDFKGVCMNFPEKNSQDPELPDFEWDELMQQQPELAHLDAQLGISKTGEGQVFFAILRSQDYAAWCKLAARVKIEAGGGMLMAEYVNDLNIKENYCKIPIDNNHNDIADKWEKDVQVYSLGMDGDFDSDERMDQKRMGDGYTLWEEYRGFVVESQLLYKPDRVQVKGHHVRTDPEYKDNFIYDEDGLFKKFYARNNPSQLNWYYVKPGQIVWTQTGPAGMPNHRWVNFWRYAPYHYARQFAIHLVDGKIVMSSPTNSGEALRESDFEPMNVKNIFRVEVYTTVIEMWAQGIGSFNWVKSGPQCQNFLDLQTHITVIHEVGHGLGIVHHIHPETHLNDDANNWVGVSTCCIRYGSPQETAGRGCELQMNYCRKGQTYSIPNLPGQFQAQNCWGQIDVKSDP